MIYSAPYILLIGFYGFMAWWFYSTDTKKSHMWNIIICLVVSLLFWGFRGFIFYDWMSYYPAFTSLNTQDIANSKIWSMEPGFALLMTISKLIYDDYHFFVFICSAINLGLLSRFIFKHIDNFPFGLFICTCIVGFYLFTDLMRNAISIFIFINAVDYIWERKPLKYYALCLLSITFHYSAILYLPLYFFAHKKINKWIYSLVFFIGCTIFVFNIPILSSTVEFIVSMISPEIEEKIHFYITEIANKKPGINFVFFEYILTASLAIFYMNKLRSVRKSANVYINCLLLFFVMTFYLHEFVTLSFRLSLLFACGYWIIWNDILKCIIYKNNKKIFVIFIFAYCLLRIYGHTRNRLADYNNIIFDSETYQQRQSIFNKNFKE